MGTNNPYLLPYLWEKSINKHKKAICGWCGCKVVMPPRPQTSNKGLQQNHATVDHILPRSRGGKSSIVAIPGPQGHRRNGDYANVKLSCYQCNNLRDIAGHCIGALHCAYAVVGMHKQKVSTWLNKLPNAKMTNQVGFVEDIS